MKRIKRLLITLFAFSLTTFFAGSAMAAGNINYFSEYLGHVTTPQATAKVIAADRAVESQPVVISATTSNGLTYSSEYMGGKTTLTKEAKTLDKDRTIMAKPDTITNTNGRTCMAKFYSEYAAAYKCL